MVDLSSLHDHSLFGGITETQISSIRHFFTMEEFDVFSLMIINLARDISRRLRKTDEIIALCPEINRLNE